MEGIQKGLPFVCILSQTNQMHFSHITSSKSILILSFYLLRVLHIPFICNLVFINQQQSILIM